MVEETQEKSVYRLIKTDEDTYRIERLFNDEYEPIVAVTEPAGSTYWWRPTPTGRVNGKVFMSGPLEDCRSHVDLLRQYDSDVGEPPEGPSEENIIYL
ncbi:hypothetical protein HGO37_07855 [Rhizobium sp. CG4]|uniref:hypothetical protein n=1 Tax=Rhizobium sp. CG4 TaxID=2726075 RepID=UPI0020332661|nr:hypothetical protein [Rhizobium sp. CG4]MCM2455294.1 hypothetical protein [Rhizobium sp. CG4]